MTREEAKDFIDRYFELRKPLVEYIAKVREQAEEEGYVETYFGRRRPTPDVKSSNFMVREGAYRQAVNMPIQGTAADVMKMAMIEIEKKISAEAEMLLQVHDSVLIEVQEWKAKKLAKQVKEIMESVYKMPVALDVDVNIAPDWGEL
jgi:DNA polymerase-1